MSPDRGLTIGDEDTDDDVGPDFVPPGESFTIRAILAGLVVGLVICFSNMYFGLQTGWVSSMTMPSSLLGFGIFRILQPHLSFPFSPVENVLVQTVAGSMAIMPLGCGFVGVIPAMNYLLAPEEQGPIFISLWKMILWSLGLCYFGVVFAVPLRHQVIIREKLRFPSGFSTAVLIGVLHGQTRSSDEPGSGDSAHAGFASLVPRGPPAPQPDGHDGDAGALPGAEGAVTQDWARNIKLLLSCFAASGFYALAAYFFPSLRSLPIFGTVAAEKWLWTFNPSLAYVGQGIIMGPETTLHMLLGAVVGWAVLSPLAYYMHWAPGPISDWETGSKGWIVWISLAIMLSDSVISLGYVSYQSLIQMVPGQLAQGIRVGLGEGRLGGALSKIRWGAGYTPLRTDDEHDTVDPSEESLPAPATFRQEPVTAGAPPAYKVVEGDMDAPPHQRIGGRVVWLGLGLSIALCIGTINLVFGNLVPLHATIIAVGMALVLSIMGVRALGETDLNPVSGISKLAQLFFAVIIPQSNKASVLINLVAGAVSEAGALQAGDMMQDLKTGHLLGAAPSAQFWGQVIGATVGAVVSALIYSLYQTAYEIPGELFQVPTSFVWIFTARLVTGKGLPPMAREWAAGAAIIFAVLTAVRTISVAKSWRKYLPGGIAVAVGMYNVPSFTLARALGGILSWYWASRTERSHTRLVIIASGFILGEGVMSIFNLALQSLRIPHF